MREEDIVVSLSEALPIFKFETASLVRHEFNKDFLRVLPIESQPKMEEVYYHHKAISRHVEKTLEHYLSIAFHLRCLKDSEAYRYVRQEGEKGYESFYRFCEDVFHFSPTNVKRMLAVCYRYCDGSATLKYKAYEEFSFRKLSIMATFERGLDEKIFSYSANLYENARISVRQLEDLRKYYSKNNWEVSSKTTWKEDLATYQAELELDKKMKQAQKGAFAFESLREEKARASSEETVKVDKKSKRYYTDLDKLMSFFDGTCRSVAELKKKHPSFADDLDEVFAYLQGKSQALHRVKYDSVLDRL